MFRSKLVICFGGLLLAVLCFFGFSSVGATTLQSTSKANAETNSYTIAFDISEYTNPNIITKITYYDVTKPESERVVEKSSVENITYTYTDGDPSEKVYLYNLVADGRTFSGWAAYITTYDIRKAKKDETTGFYYIDSSLKQNYTLEPVFDMINYEITYNFYEYNDSTGTYSPLDGVTNDNKLTYTVEAEIELKKPDKTGFTFLGWFKDASFTQPIEKIEKGTKSNLTLYAKFEVQTCVLDFAWGDYEDIKLKYGNEVTESMLPQPTREGYEFGGWFTNAGFTYQIKPGYQMVGNVTLYPKWIKLENPLWKPLTFGGMGIVLVLSGVWFIVFKKKAKNII